jgi:hypothetical protein
MKAKLLIGLLLLAIVLSGCIEQPPTEGFTQSELESISAAKAAWVDSGGHDSTFMSEIFNQTGLQNSLKICENELITEAGTCYRLLAVEFPENKDDICSNLTEEEFEAACLSLSAFIE